MWSVGVTQRPGQPHGYPWTLPGRTKKRESSSWPLVDPELPPVAEGPHLTVQDVLNSVANVQVFSNQQARKTSLKTSHCEDASMEITFSKHVEVKSSRKCVQNRRTPNSWALERKKCTKKGGGWGRRNIICITHFLGSDSYHHSPGSKSVLNTGGFGNGKEDLQPGISSLCGSLLDSSRGPVRSLLRHDWLWQETLGV